MANRCSSAQVHQIDHKRCIRLVVLTGSHYGEPVSNYIISDVVEGTTFMMYLSHITSISSIHHLVVKFKSQLHLEWNYSKKSYDLQQKYLQCVNNPVKLTWSLACSGYMTGSISRTALCGQ